MQRNVNNILKTCLSPHETYCAGAALGSGKGYIVAPNISSGTVKVRCSHAGSQLLDEIIAFDKAESSEADLTQANMITVSSFNGIKGVVLGYDILKQPIKHHPFYPESNANIYDIKPLCQATKALFGTVKQKMFPIAPGEHLPCTYRTIRQRGPTILYASLALAIAKDRAVGADLFMEDLGTMSDNSNQAKKRILNNLIRSVDAITENIGIRYEKIFLDIITLEVSQDEIGCTLIAVPYITIPKAAIPSKKSIEDLAKLSLEDWKKQISRNRPTQKEPVFGFLNKI